MSIVQPSRKDTLVVLFIGCIVIAELALVGTVSWFLAQLFNN